MSTGYRIFGAEVSPYSVKVRSYFRYKQIPHEWIVRGPASAAEYQKYAKLPIIPLVVSPDGEAMQDSTPILEVLEARYPEPSIHPDDPIAAFVSALLEEFGDEWANKWMFHYRWAREADQVSASERIGAAMSGASGDALQQVAAGIRDRMINRVWFVGVVPLRAASSTISRTSLICCERRACGVKSPSTILGPLASMIREYAGLLLSTLNVSTLDNPAVSANTSPSANATRFKPRTRLVASFILAAFPQGPR